MPRLTLFPFALALLVCANGCASSHKHAEVPDFTEKGWSEPNPAYAQTKVDTPIQPAPVLTSAEASGTPPDGASTSETTDSDAAKPIKPGKKKPATRKKNAGKKKAT